MYQIKFNSSDCHKRYPPEDFIFLEIDYNGTHVRIDIGQSIDDNTPPCIAISGYGKLTILSRAENAIDIGVEGWK